MPKILIVEDECGALNSLATLLTEEGYDALKAGDGERGLFKALSEEPDLVLLDIRLPKMDGLTILQKMRQGHNDAAVIIMTADTTSSNAIKATQYGAFDYITKPINFDHLLILVRRALEYRDLEREVRKLRSGQAEVKAYPAMVGHTPAMQQVYKLIGRVASSDATVCVVGESGTGKELVVNAIHEYSPRAHGPLVKVNCAAIPETLLEGELFGHEKGAFTHAMSRRIGSFEQANEGTLFLDEIAELPLSLQAKLLRAIQERTIERLGSNQPIQTNFRLVVASAQDLDEAVATGSFREDLFYRLSVVKICLPPLRERREDIPLLVQRFLGRSEKPVTIQQDALDRIIGHSWPGNVRELENVVARAIAIAPGGVITADCIEFPRRPAPAGIGWLASIPYHEGFKAVVHMVEAELLRAALAEVEGNKLKAAALLGIQRRLLYEKMREHGLS
jgi:two-component system response regulator AtoC